MKRLFVLLILVLAPSIYAQAQNAIIASPDEQAKIRPLVTAETKAREALNAKVVGLPEAKAFNEAQKALEKALDTLKQSPAYKTAEAELKRTADALNKAAETLPEAGAWKAAGAATLDEAYRIQADHKLSSRDFKPELSDKGDLVFSKNAPPKP